VRERTINALCDRYHVDRAQAERVELSALQALAQVGEGWGLQGEEDEHLLRWAARLHEIGLAIAHNSYHKHGAYLVENSDMPGFSSSEQKLLAVLVRGHRRKYPQSLFKEFSKRQSQRLQRLCLLLRMAVLLHRSHSDEVQPVPRFYAEEKKLSLRFSEGWLAEHPLTEADLEQEAAYLQSAKFELVYG